MMNALTGSLTYPMTVSAFKSSGGASSLKSDLASIIGTTADKVRILAVTSPDATVYYEYEIDD